MSAHLIPRFASLPQVADLSIDHFWAYMWEAYNRLDDEAALSNGQAKWGKGYASLLAKTVPDATADANIYRLHLDAADRRRVFFTENKAYVGLGSSIMQENDILCIESRHGLAALNF